MQNATTKKRFYKRWSFWIKLVIIIYCGIGIALYYLQEKLLFQPEALPQDYKYSFNVPFKEVNIPWNQNENLNIVQFFPKDSVRKGVVLYFHGNRTNINRYAGIAPNFTNNGYEVWMADYPGYGKTTGKLTEKRLYDLSMQVYKLANSKYSKDSIIIYGRSLGSGVASQLASVKDCRRLILETPYSSIPDLFSCYAPIYPTSMMAHFKIPSKEYLLEVDAPITIFHGDDDDVVPYRCAAKLKKSLKPTDEFVTIEKGKHNDLNNFDIYHRKLDSLLSR